MNTAVGCERCGASIGPGQRFCGVCGTPVPIGCAACGTPVAPDARFCPQCGEAIPLHPGAGDPNLGPISPPPVGPGPVSPSPALPSDLGAAGSTGRTSGGSWPRVAAQLQDATRGEFVIERELGRGGMAAVYLAREVRLNRWVALKVMSPALLSGEGMVERFQQEAVTVANLSHANIVTIHAVREVDDLHFIVMQFVEGRALDRVLHEAGRLPPALVRAIVFQVGSALAYAHRRGVVHRDVKPANILIDTDGHAVVTDFGIAKVTESVAHTQTGMIIGTPNYMSPEQCMGLPVSAASDQYALGIVTFELLAGHVPFGGTSLVVLQQHVSAPVGPLIRTLPPECPPEMLAALERMLAKNPADRWPSVLSAVAALGGRVLADDDPLRETLARLSRPVPKPAAVRVALSATRLEVGDAAQVTAEVVATDGTTLADAPVAWSAEPPELVSIDAGTGRLVGLAAGQARIRATSGPASGEALLDVVPAEPATISVVPPPAPLRVCDRWRPAVAVLDRRGAPVDVAVTLEPLDPPRVTVTDTGEVEAIEPGAGGVRVRAGALEHDVPLSIEPAAVASLELDAPAEPLFVGDQLRCTAVARDARGRPLPEERVVWSVSGPARATVDADGTVTFLAAGEVAIRARAGERQATLTRHVRPARAARITVVAPLTVLREGERTRLTAEVWDVRGAPLSRPVSWRSSDASTVEVGPDGTVEARALGAAEITARCEDVESSVEIQVTVSSATALFQPTPPPSGEAPPVPEWLEGPTTADRDEPPAGVLPVDTAVGQEQAAADDDTIEAEPVAAAPIARPAAALPAVEALAARGNAAAGRRRPTRWLMAGVAGAVLLGAGGWLLTRSGDDSEAPAAAALPPTSEPASPASPTSAGTTPPAAPSAAPAAGVATRPTAAESSVKTVPAPPPATPGGARGGVADRGAGRDVASVPRPSPSGAPAPTTPSRGARTPQRGDSAASRSPVASAPTAPLPEPRPTATAPAGRAAAPDSGTPATAAGARTDAAGANARAEARAGMQRAIEAYVAGVRGRNVGAMQRVFPGMPAEMRQNWAALFSAVRSVDAQAAALEIEPSGSDAGSAQLLLRVRFPNPASRRECVQETRLRLQLVQTGGVWRIVELTQLSSTGSPGCG